MAFLKNTPSKEALRYIIEDENCLPGGTKEACLIVWHAIQTSEGNKVTLSEEALEAVRVLVAASFRREDIAPAMGQCQSDCCHIYNQLCSGAMFVSNKTGKMCPFYVTEDK